MLPVSTFQAHRFPQRSPLKPTPGRNRLLRFSASFSCSEASVHVPVPHHHVVHLAMEETGSHVALGYLSPLFVVSRFAGAVSGPIGFLATCMGLCISAIMYIVFLVTRKVRDCEDCKGFGVKRCTLCEGKGIVGWKWKMSYEDVCPMCAKKRFANCGTCGGFVPGRKLFAHKKPIPAPSAGAAESGNEDLGLQWSRLRLGRL